MSSAYEDFAPSPPPGLCSLAPGGLPSFRSPHCPPLEKILRSPMQPAEGLWRLAGRDANSRVNVREGNFPRRCSGANCPRWKYPEQIVRWWKFVEGKRSGESPDFRAVTCSGYDFCHSG